MKSDLTDAIIDAVVARYWREQDRYMKLGVRVSEICRALIEENTIRAQVTFRVKAPDRLRGKLKNFQRDASKSKGLTDADLVFARIGDLAGVRITTYEERDRPQVTDLVRDAFAGPAGHSAPVVDIKNKHDHDRKNFYRATHCQVALRSEELVGTYSNLKGLTCEVQICSMFAHVWNEIEHDLRYKPLVGDLSDTEEELIQQLGHLTVAGDSAIRLLLEAVERRHATQSGSFEDHFDFVAAMKKVYPGLSDLGRHAQQLYEELAVHKVDTVDKLTAFLAPTEISDLQGLLDDFGGWLAVNHPSKVYGALVRTGSDVVLMRLLERDADKVVARHPVGLGQGRPPRIAWLARRFLEWRAEAESVGSVEADAGADIAAPQSPANAE